MLDLSLTDGQYLVLFLIGLYFIEGLVWIPHGATLFLANGISGRCRPRNGNFRPLETGSIQLLDPFPAAYGYVCQQWPISLSPTGIYAYVSQATHDGRRPTHEEMYLSWDEIASVVVSDRDVLVNSRKFVRVCSGGFAIALRETLLKLRSSSDEQRAVVIDDALRKTLDVNEIRQRISHFRRASRSLIWPSIGMWLTLVAVLPLVMWSPFQQPWTVNATWLAAVAFGCSWAIQLIGYGFALRRMRRLVPRAQLPNRTWLLCVSPPTALWARDRLARDLLSEFHPLAIAAVVCSPDELRRLAGQTLRDLLNPMLPVCPSTDGPAQQVEVWFRGRLLAAAKQTIIDAGVSIDALLAPPVPDGDDVRSYCPRCLSQYVLKQGTCPACGGIALHSLAP